MGGTCGPNETPSKYLQFGKESGDQKETRGEGSIEKELKEIQ